MTGNPGGAPGTFGLTAGTVDSDSEAFIIPQCGQNWMLDSESSIDISVYGNGGMITDYRCAAVPFGTFYGGTSGPIWHSSLLLPHMHKKSLTQLSGE